MAISKKKKKKFKKKTCLGSNKATTCFGNIGCSALRNLARRGMGDKVETKGARACTSVVEMDRNSPSPLNIDNGK